MPFPWLWKFFLLPRCYRHCCDLESRVWQTFSSGLAR